MHNQDNCIAKIVLSDIYSLQKELIEIAKQERRTFFIKQAVNYHICSYVDMRTLMSALVSEQKMVPHLLKETNGII